MRRRKTKLDPEAFVHVAETLLRSANHRGVTGTWHDVDILCEALAQELLKKWPHKKLPKNCGLSIDPDGNPRPKYIYLRQG